MKVLIIRLSAIGDTIHSLPVAAAIKRAIPAAEVSWMVEPPSAPLLINNPAIDRVFILPKREWLASLSSPLQIPSAITGIGAWWSDVRSHKFDVALDLQGLLKSAACSLVSGSSMRLGFARTREGAEKLLTDRVDIGDYFFPECHIVDLNLKLVDYLTSKLDRTKSAENEDKVVEFPLPPVPLESAERINKFLSALYDQQPDKSMVPNAVLIPGTTWATKIWDKEKWYQLGRLLITEMGLNINLVGGKAETADNAYIYSRLKEEFSEKQVIDLTGQTSLLDLIALYERSRLVVGADSGPLHLAAATGKPAVVAIFGSTPWQRNGPYGSKCRSVSLRLWCQPCFEKRCPLSTIACLRDLPAETVYTEIVDHLRQIE